MNAETQSWSGAIRTAFRYTLTYFFVLLFIALILMALSSCSALRKNLYTGGGAAAGAVGGALVGGPVGAGVGAAAGAIAVGATAETQEYRDGSVVGEEALEKELRRWRGEAITAEAKATKLSTWIWLGALAVGVWFVFRNRAHLLAFGPGYVSKLWHAISGFSAPSV